jgi:hypothetical protein
MFKKIKTSAGNMFACLLLVASIVLPTISHAIESQYVYVENFSIKDSTKSIYKVGERVEGSFLLRNAGDKDVSNISYKVSLIQQSAISSNKDIKQFNTIAADMYPARSIGAKAKTDVIPFTFTIPTNAKGAGFEIKVEAISSAGFPLSWNESTPFSIDNPENILTIKNASVLLSNGQEYRPESGFILHGDREAKSARLNVILENKNAEVVMTRPMVSVYAWPIAEGEQPLNTTMLAEQSVAANGTSSVVYDIPTFEYAPGIYEARIDFQNANGKGLTRTQVLKYAIGGEMATIHSLTSVNSIANKGDTIIVNASVTGMPADFGADATAPASSTLDNIAAQPDVSNKTQLHLTIMNERGAIVAEDFKDADLSAENEFNFSLPALKNAKAMHAILIVENQDKKILAQYEGDLSADYFEKKSDWQKSRIIYGAAGIVLLLIIIAIIIMRRKKSGGNPSGSVPAAGAMPLMLLVFAIIATGAIFSALISSSAMAATYNTNPASLGFKYKVLDWYSLNVYECGGRLDVFTTEQAWYDTAWQDTPRNGRQCRSDESRAAQTPAEFRDFLTRENLISKPAYNQTIFVSSPAIDAEFEPGETVRISGMAKYTSGGYTTAGADDTSKFYMGTVVDSATTPTDLALSIAALPPFSNPSFSPDPYGEGLFATYPGSPVVSSTDGDGDEYVSDWMLDTGTRYTAPNSIGIKKFWIGSLSKTRVGAGTFFGGAMHMKYWIQVKGYQEYKVIPARPTNLIALPATACSNTVNFSWTPPSASNLALIDGYRLYRSTSATGPYVLINGSIPKTSVTTSDVIPAGMTGTLHYRLVSYHLATGFESRPADTSVAVTGGQICPSAILSCSVSPSSPVIGESTTWTAIPGAGDMATYTYSWSGAVSGTGASVNQSFGSSGTKTGTVTATAGAIVRTATCSVTVNDDTTTCTPWVPGCPGTGTGSCAAVPDVATGSTLTSSPRLCTGTAVLLGTVNVNVGRTGWVWQCRQGTAAPENCTARCASGIYSVTSGECSDTPDDICDNIDDVQTPADSSSYEVTSEGGRSICLPKEGEIKYFKFQPDTVETACPAYWDTVLPDRSLGFDSTCTIDGLTEIDDAGGTPHTVGWSNLLPPNPTGRAWYLRPVQRLHTLTCTIKDFDGVTRKRLEANARCYKLPETIEI